MSLLTRVKTLLGSKTQDKEGWVRQGKFTPVKNLRDMAADSEGWFQQGKFTPKQPVQQMGQNLQAWGNIASQGIKNQVDIQKRDFKDYFWNPIKENPVLRPTAERFEAAAPALVRQLNPLGDKTNLKQNWQDTKKVGAAALTAYGLLKAPVAAVLGGAAINPLFKLGSNVHENKKGRDIEKLNLGQSRTGIPDWMQQTPYKKKPITEGVLESVSEGAGMGLANAGTTRLTNSIVQGLSSYIPKLRPLTEKAIAQGAPVVTDTLKEGVRKFFNTAGKRFIKAAVIETAVETPIWATLTQTEQESYLQAIEREAVENLIMNVGMAGVNILTDTKSLLPIVNKSIKETVNNTFYNPDGSLKMRSGATRLLTPDTQPIKTGTNSKLQTLINEKQKYKTPQEFVDAIQPKDNLSKMFDDIQSKSKTLIKVPTEESFNSLLKKSDPQRYQNIINSEKEAIRLVKIMDKTVRDISGNDIRQIYLNSPGLEDTVYNLYKQLDSPKPISPIKTGENGFIDQTGRLIPTGDHSEAAFKQFKESANKEEALTELMTRGNIRTVIKPNEVNFEVIGKPTDSQLNVMMNQSSGKKIYIDLTDTKGNLIESKSFNDADNFLSYLKSKFSSQPIKTGGDTIKIKPSEKIKIKPTLENPVASPQTSKLPKTQQQLETNPLNPVIKPESTLADSPSPYFNTNNLNIKDKAKTFVTKTIEEVKPEIEKITGRKLTNKEAVEFANNSAGVLNKVVTRTETLAWEAKMLKARELLSKQASEGKITQEYLDNLLAIKSQGSDIARKLQSLSMGADPKEATAKQAILEAILKVTDDTEALLKKAKGVDFNDYDQAASFYRQFVKPKAGDWLEKVRYSSMLSSPNTHINNASSNFQGTGIIAPIEKTISGQVDWLLSAINPNRKRQQFAGEGAAYAKGYYSKIGNAWTKFTDTMTGKKLSSAQEMYSLPLTEKGTVGRKIENVLTVPGKLLQAADEFFQTLTEGGSAEALKLRESKGIKIRDIEGQAYLEGRKRLFNSGFGLKEEGYVLKAVEFIPQKVAEARMSSNPVISTIAKYTFPFVRVPSNVLKASVEYGPLGATTLPGASNKVEQLSKAILGTSIGLAVAALVGEDRLTWAEPRDEKKRNAARAAGWQPYSLKIGNNYYSFSKMHPAISFNLALVAAVRDSEKKKLLDDGQVETVLNGLAKWVNFYADMSYVKNIGDAVSGINGDLSAGTRQVSNYVQQLVPFRALMGWVTRIVDPYQRQVDSKGEILGKQLQQLMTQIPGLSSQVPARLDSKGNPIENPHRLINAFSPARVTTEKSKLMSEYKMFEGLAQSNKQEAVIKQQVTDTGQEQIFNGKKYYPSFETDSKTGEKKPVVKSIKVTQSMSEIYQGLDKKYSVSEDAPKNFISKVITYGKGIFKDPEGTINAIKTGQPIRKVRADAVIVERLRGLDTLDAGDTATEVDHIIPIAFGGDNSEKNLAIIAKQDNRAKGVVGNYLLKEWESGRITKSEAINRVINWRNEIPNLSASDKSKVSNIMAKEPPVPTKVDNNILSTLSSKEYQIYDEEKQTYSNIKIKIPEYPKLTGYSEVDKQLKSKYSSALSTAKSNIGKLLMAEKITAQEANNALIAINNLRSKSSGKSSKAKGGKIAIKKSTVKLSKLPTFKAPSFGKLGTSYKTIARPNIKLSKPKTIAVAKKKSNTIKIKPMPTMKVAKGGFLG